MSRHADDLPTSSPQGVFPVSPFVLQNASALILVMPTILRIGPYRFHFYSREPNEPPHIHVERNDLEAKFWLEPVSLAKNYGFPAKELNELARLVETYKADLVKAWVKFHG